MSDSPSAVSTRRRRSEPTNCWMNSVSYPSCRTGVRMKYVDEYRDREIAHKIAREIRATVTRPCVLMEICGGQTHSIVKYGVDHLLPKEVELVHGPGCPVCVTSLEMIDKAHHI